MTPIPPDVVLGAQVSEAKWHVPASVTIAQWALESGWGQHIPPGSFNPFGIKAQPGEPFVSCWTREVIDGEVRRVPANFRRYASWTEAFDEHGEFLATNPRYAAAFALTNGIDFAEAVAAAGYATDPQYGQELVAIITDHDLTQYEGII